MVGGWQTQSRLISHILGLISGDTVVTHSPPTSEVSGSNPKPYVGKAVASYRWSAVNSTEP